MLKKNINQQIQLIISIIAAFCNSQLAATDIDFLQVDAGTVCYEQKMVSFEGAVKLDFGKDGVLTCTSADYNLDEDSFLIHGEPNEKIIFKQPNVLVTCYEARVLLNEDRTITRLEVQGNVHLEYCHDLNVVADRGWYEKGVIHLSGEKECHLENAAEDQIDATEVTFDIEGKKIEMVLPHGNLNSQPYPTYFSAKRLFWSLDQELITLENDVTINRQDMGELAASHQLILNKALKNMTALGQIRLAFLGKNTIDMDGTFYLDHLKHMATLHSPYSLIHFHDPLGNIKAHHAKLEYAGGERPSVTRLEVEEDVRIVTLATVEHVLSETELHTILTDYAKFEPAARTLLLEANQGSRTLLYDHVNHLHVSAPKLRLQRDKRSGKDKIEGFGDIKFSFSEKELEVFKQQFSWVK